MVSDIVPCVTTEGDSRFPSVGYSHGTRRERPVHHRRPVARRLPERGRAPGRAHPEPRPAGRGRRLVPAPFRPGRAVRAEPGVALHRHVPDEPPVGAQRHAARRPPRQRRARRPAPRLRAGAVRLHRHERRPPHGRARRPRACSATKACCPGFDPVCHLPEGDPFEWLDWMRADGRGRARRLAHVRRPARPRRAQWRTQYDAAHSQTVFLTDRLLDFADDRIDAGTPWFAHVSYLRPHPPFLAPAPYDTMFDPASVPAPVPRARRAPRRARSTRCSA